ncbi:hypothetical protein N7492_002531 [Penicillium capsulatum]|uniref:Uncharacterized protein n=1 Tax=Penicillium capsulatum TaxID=69766 RepID=A0A9W9LVA4_9EURO|nr:hypothetical protein N7492_002531 [Penicillium capsulatum]KAJ6122865.1 hypothetical protein N7512_005330 [Penicillium capsulatum]
MSIPEPSSTHRNGATVAPLTRTNVTQIPKVASSNLERFARAPVSDSPYFLGSRLQEPSTHLAGLTSQLSALDAMFKAGN